MHTIHLIGVFITALWSYGLLGYFSGRPRTHDDSPLLILGDGLVFALGITLIFV